MTKSKEVAVEEAWPSTGEGGLAIRKPVPLRGRLILGGGTEGEIFSPGRLDIQFGATSCL